MALQGLQDQREAPVQPDRQDRRVLMVRQVLPDLRLASALRQQAQVLLGLLRAGRTQQKSLPFPYPQGRQDRPDLQDHPDLQAVMVLQVLQVQQDLQGRQGQTVLQGLQDLQDQTLINGLHRAVTQAAVQMATFTLTHLTIKYLKKLVEHGPKLQT